MFGVLLAIGLLLLTFGMMAGVTLFSPTARRPAAELEAESVDGDTECHFCEAQRRCLDVYGRPVCPTCVEKYFDSGVS